MRDLIDARLMGTARACTAGSRTVLLALIVLSVTACASAATPAAPSAGSPAQPGAAAAPAPTAPPDKVKITHASTGMSSLPLFVARDRGFFAANGLEPEVALLGSDRAAAAVASGELHYVGGVGSASLSAAALGLPIRAVWVSTDRPAYTLFVRPEVTSVAQLRGKRVGVEGIGGATAMALSVALKRYGIDPTQDMTMLQIGGDQLQLESLRNGAIDAAALLVPIALLARADGFTPLLNIGELVQMPQGGLSTTLTKLTQERDQARRVIRAHMQAQQWIVQNREATVQFLVDLVGADPADAAAAYDETMPTYQGKGQVTREGIEAYLQVLREAGRIGPETRYEDVADNSLAEEVGRELGLIP